MTSKESTKKQGGTNPPLHNAKYNIKSASKIAVIILALHLVAMPVMMINAIYNITNGISSEPSDWTFVIAVIATAAAGASGIIIAAMNFRYLFNRSQVDMCLSQPMSRKQRFFSDYLSGLAAYILPFIAVQLLTAIFIVCGVIFVDGKTYTIFNYYGNGETYEFVCDFFTTLAPFYAKLVFIGILTMIMLYTVTVFIFVCCGTLFESIFYTVLLNVAVPLSIYLVYSGFFSELFGINFEREFSYIFSCTSVAGGIMAAVLMLDEGLNMIKWLIAFALVIAAIFIGSYFLYMKRKAEHTGKPFVFIGLYYFAATLVMLCIVSIFLLTGSSISSVIIPLIITTVIVYLLLEIVVNRGFKKLWKGIIRYAVTVGVFIAVLIAADTTFLFGIETKVPEAKNVKSVTLSYAGIYGQLPTGYMYSVKNAYKDDDNYFYTLRSTENINAVIAAHQLVIDNYKTNRNSYKKYNFYKTSYSYENNSNTYTDIVICYNMKNGTKTERHYQLTTDAVNAIKSVDVSEEMKAQAADYFRDLFVKSYDDTSGVVYFDGSKPRSYVKVRTSADLFKDYSDGITYYPDREFFVRYGEAMAEDILAMTPDALFEPTEYFSFTTNSRTHCITNAYTNTRRLLAEYGYIPNITEEALKSELTSGSLTEGRNCEIRILSPDDFKDFTGSDVIYTQQNIYSGGRYVIYYSDELAKLTEVMQLVYITEKPCYTITVNGSLYAIPEEYSAIAEQVYASAYDEPIYDEANDRFLYYGAVIS